MKIVATCDNPAAAIDYEVVDLTVSESQLTISKSSDNLAYTHLSYPIEKENVGTLRVTVSLPDGKSSSYKVILDAVDES